MITKVLNIKISIDNHKTQYYKNNSPIRLNNLELNENNGEIVSNYGNLQISHKYFKDNIGFKDNNEYIVSIEQWQTLFNGIGIIQEINKDWVTLKLYSFPIDNDVDLLDEYTCDNCDEEKYYIPLIFGKEKYIQLPLLKKSTQSYLLTKNGFATESYSGSSKINSTIVDNNILLWNNPLRDVYFDVIEDDYNNYNDLSKVSINLSSTSNKLSYSINFEEDSKNKVQIYWRKKLQTVFEPLFNDYIYENKSGNKSLPSYVNSDNLSSLKSYEFKAVIFNKDYSTINNYYTSSITTINTSDKDRLEHIERNINSLSSRLSSENTSRINNDLSLSRKIDDTSNELTEKIELNDEQINEKIDNMLSLNGSVLTVNTHDVILNTLYATNIKSDEATIDKIKNNELRTSLIIIDNKNLNKDYFTNLDELTSYFVKSDNITVKNNLPILFSSRLTSEYLSATTKITTGQVDTKNINLDNFNIDKPFIQNLQRNDLDFEDRIKNLETAINDLKTQINDVKSNSDVDSRFSKINNALSSIRGSIAVLSDKIDQATGV